MFFLGLLLLFVGSPLGFSQTAAPQRDQAPPEAYAHHTAITTLAFSPNGRWLASGDKHGVVLFWQLPEWRPIHRVNLDDAVHQLIFDRESRRLLVVAGTNLSSIAVDDPTEHQAIPLPAYKRPKVVVALSPDGKTLAIGRGNLYLYDYPGLTLTKTYEYDEDDGRITYFENLAFRPDGKELAVQVSNSPPIDQIQRDDGTVEQNFVVKEPVVNLNWDWRRAMGYSGDGRLLAVSNNHGLSLYRVDTRVAKELWGHRDMIHALAFSPDGRTLISAGADQQIIGRNLPTGRNIFVRNAPASVRALAVSPDGATFACAGMDQAISLWSLRNLERTEPLKVLGTPIRTINHRPALPALYAVRQGSLWMKLSFEILLLMLLAPGLSGIRHTLSQPAVVVLLGCYLTLKITLYFVHDHFLKGFTANEAQDLGAFSLQLVYYALVLITGAGLCRKLGWRVCFFAAPDDTQRNQPWWQRLLWAVGEGTAVLFLMLLYSKMLFDSFPPVGFEMAMTNDPSIALVQDWLDEEIIFRLGWFTALAYWLKHVRFGLVIAVVGSAVLFAFLHLFNLDPLWLKWLQILPFGLALCRLYRRHGIEICMLVHVAFNALGILFWR